MYSITDDRAVLARQLDHPSTSDQVFAILDDQDPVGWIAFRESETAPPDLLGDLPATEIHVTAIALPWDGDWMGAGHRLLSHAFEAIEPGQARYITYRINPEFRSHTTERIAVAESVGMYLFQEKEGFHWFGEPEKPATTGRLTYKSITETGRDLYANTISRAGNATLDRNDHWYRTMCGADNWGEVFVSMCEDTEADSWVMGYDQNGEVVGFVAVSEIPPHSPTKWDTHPCGTIVFVGVVPEHRGHGYVDELVLTAQQIADRRGFMGLVDTVDIENQPMTSAMVRNGYLPDFRPWHDWFYRYDLDPDLRSGNTQGSQRDR